MAACLLLRWPSLFPPPEPVLFLSDRQFITILRAFPWESDYNDRNSRVIAPPTSIRAINERPLPSHPQVQQLLQTDWPLLFRLVSADRPTGSGGFSGQKQSTRQNHPSR